MKGSLPLLVPPDLEGDAAGDDTVSMALPGEEEGWEKAGGEDAGRGEDDAWWELCFVGVEKGGCKEDAWGR